MVLRVHVQQNAQDHANSLAKESQAKDAVVVVVSDVKKMISRIA